MSRSRSVFSTGVMSVCSSVVAITVLISAVASADDTEIYFADNLSADNNVANVLFMFDTSGSMAEYNGASTSGINRLKRAMIDVVESTNGVGIGIGSFNGDTRGGAIRVPATGLADDLCPGAACDSIKLRAEIKSREDDAVEMVSGEVKLWENSLTIDTQSELISTFDLELDTDTDSVIALRFDDLNIPRGAKINHATLQLISFDTFGTDSSNVTVVGHASDDSAPLEASSNNLRNRYKPAGAGTNATVNWDIEEWPRKNTKHFSPDLKSIVNEITDRPGWCGGNALTLILHGSGHRTAFAKHQNGWSEPVLQIDYDPSSVDFADTCLRLRTHATVDNAIDDVMEDSATGVIQASTDLLRTHVDGSAQTMGLRFSDVSVPSNASISAAYLQLTSGGYTDGDIHLDIAIENSDYSAAIDAQQNLALSSRSFASTTKRWYWIPKVDKGNTLKSVNISELVEQVVGNSGWADNGAMTFKLTPVAPDSASVGQRYFTTADSPAGAGARLVIHYKQNSADLNNTAPVLQTGRDEVIRTMLDFDSDGGTPLVDAYYEATQYMRGEAVTYGLKRGTQSTYDRVHRVSVASSYTGAESVYRPPGCWDVNLSAQACITEEIKGSPDYIKPAFGECKANQIVLLSDGEANYNNSKDLIRTLTGESCATRSTAAEECGIELAQWMYESNRDESSNALQSVVTHTVGFNFSSPFLSELASAGGGQFFEASSASDLTSAFNSIIQTAITKSTSFTVPSTSVSLDNRLVNSNEVYYAMFAPSTRTHWNGNLKRYELAANNTTGTVEVRDALSQPALDENGAIKDQAKSFWSSTADGSDVALGGAASKLPQTRSLYTSLYNELESKTSLQNFHEDNDAIDHAALGIDGTNETYRTELLKWARGVDVKDYDGDGNITEVRAQMGDPLHSSQFIINYEGAGTATDSTATDGGDAAGTTADVAPRSLIFIGTNHGFLHAIDTRTGVEEFAYIPEDLLSNLDYFYRDEPVRHYQRPYGLDGEVSGWHDDKNGNGYVDGEEKAYIYVGMRRGGRNYYALDVTDPDSPRFLWQIEGGSGAFAELGQSWSRLIKSRVKYLGAEKDVLLFAAGYDKANDNEPHRTVDAMGRGIYMVDASTGALVTSRDSDDFASMTYSIPSDLRVIDPNGDGLADAIFVGDTGGQVWRFDINHDATTDAGFISGTVAASFGGAPAQDNRQFFYEPDIALVKNNQGRMSLNIAIGSGSRPNPNAQTVNDRFYSFHDSSIFGPPRNDEGAIEYPNSVTESDLVNVSSTLGSRDDSGNLSNGWFFELPATGEKSLSSALTVDNELFFTTYVPASSTANICTAAVGSGRVYKLDVFSGDPLNNSDVLTDRYSELQQPGIPPRVTGLIVEASPNVVSKFVGLEAIGEGVSRGPFERIFWAEQ